MTNTKKLKDYLIGKDDAYLLNKNSNGKVIMLSGAWGSGKTHFWKNQIEISLIKKQKANKKAYAYVSLYGKTSIDSIEMDLLMNAYNSVIGDADIVSKMCSTSLSYGKKIGSILSSGITALTAGAVEADVTKIAKEVENLINNDKLTKAGEFLNDGGIVCFDDFERKSKEIDLNDLFGFITQLTLNLKCKVVIILNSDVFEGKEKEIFTTVKEKSISKYLMFNPTCEELFEIIFDEKYKNLEEHKQILKDIFVEVGIVNARILIQVLDNWLEWVDNKNSDTDFYLRYFVLVNINFILNHHMFVASLDKKDISKRFQNEYGEVERHKPIYEDATNSIIKSDIDYEYIIFYLSWTKKYNDKCIENVKKRIEIKDKDNGEDRDVLLAFINRNESLVKSLHFMKCFEINEYGESNNQAEVDMLNKINSFIETGVL